MYDKTDFINDYEAELQAELDAEAKWETEQDHGFDRPNIINNEENKPEDK
jgi:hypothetical protein